MDIPLHVAAAGLQAAARDTVVSVAARDSLAVIQVGALVVIALGILGLFGIMLRVTLELRDLEAGLRRLIQRSEERLDPVIERARSVAENVDYVSHAVRTDVEGLAESVERIRQRLDDASGRVEERVEEFNALMQVVQAEAEEIFLDTASTVRGVRAGSRELGDRPPATEEGEES